MCNNVPHNERARATQVKFKKYLRENYFRTYESLLFFFVENWVLLWIICTSCLFYLSWIIAFRSQILFVKTSLKHSFCRQYCVFYFYFSHNVDYPARIWIPSTGFSELSSLVFKMLHLHCSQTWLAPIKIFLLIVPHRHPRLFVYGTRGLS